MPRATVQPPAAMTHEEAFRQSEGNVRLEGIDPTDFPIYNELKARILAGEITSKEAAVLLRAAYSKTAQTAA